MNWVYPTVPETLAQNFSLEPLGIIFVTTVEAFETGQHLKKWGQKHLHFSNAAQRIQISTDLKTRISKNKTYTFRIKKEVIVSKLLLMHQLTSSIQDLCIFSSNRSSRVCTILGNPLKDNIDCFKQFL